MSKKSRASLSVGPGAASLLMIVVVLCLTVLGILALISARADYKLSVRNQEMVSSYYEADGQTQRALALFDGVLKASRDASANDDAYLASVAAGLPDGFVLAGRMATYTVDAGAGRLLTMKVEIEAFDDADRRYRVDAVTLSDDVVWEDLMIEDLFNEEDLVEHLYNEEDPLETLFIE